MRPEISATTTSGTFKESTGNPVNLCLGFDIDDPDLDNYAATAILFDVTTARSGGFPERIDVVHSRHLVN